MWVRTTAGDLVNIAAAREIRLEPSYEYSPREAMQIVARFAGGHGDEAPVVLALVTGMDRSDVESQCKAMYRAVVECLRNGDQFCDLMG